MAGSQKFKVEVRQNGELSESTILCKSELPSVSITTKFASSIKETLFRFGQV